MNMTVEFPVVEQRQVPTIQTVQKTVQYLDRVIDVPREQGTCSHIHAESSVEAPQARSSSFDLAAV